VVPAQGQALAHLVQVAGAVVVAWGAAPLEDIIDVEVAWGPARIAEGLDTAGGELVPPAALVWGLRRRRCEEWDWASQHCHRCGEQDDEGGGEGVMAGSIFSD